ncbi:hypothetical protein AMTR_s00040p00186130 [Amborella trichopoda]|uniref:Uncharacterized protein n=1 Tax=Amborella trichopoda TaxID=13333 RepID=W1PSZ0_AMBTC|nr:hypothetical protein AMTR_s00040p00186130 [Amborella trichopoda]
MKQDQNCFATVVTLAPPDNEWDRQLLVDSWKSALTFCRPHANIIQCHPLSWMEDILGCNINLEKTYACAFGASLSINCSLLVSGELWKMMSIAFHCSLAFACLPMSVSFQGVLRSAGFVARKHISPYFGVWIVFFVERARDVNVYQINKVGSFGSRKVKEFR